MKLNTFEIVRNIIEMLDKDDKYRLIKFKDPSNNNKDYEESVMTFMTNIGGKPIIFKVFDVYYNDNGHTYCLEYENKHIESIGSSCSNYEDYAKFVLSREVYKSILDNFRKLYNVDLNTETGDLYINGIPSNINLIECKYGDPNKFYDKLLIFEKALKERIEEITHDIN